MKKKMVCKVLAFLSIVFFFSCSTTPQEKNVNNMMDMQRDKAELINSGIVAGFGVGESASEQMAYDEADLNARTDIARNLESKIEALLRNYQEEVGNELVEHHESVKKTVVSNLLNGVTIVNMKMEVVNENRYKVYLIAALAPKTLKDALETEIATKKVNMEDLRAITGYGDLNKEVQKLDEYKAKAATTK